MEAVPHADHDLPYRYSMQVHCHTRVGSSKCSCSKCHRARGTGQLSRSMPMQCPCNAMQSTRGTVHSRSQIDTCYWRSKILVRIHIVTRAESSASLRYECEWSDSIARPNRPVGTGIRQEVSIVIWPASGSGLGSGQGSGDVADQADFEQINVGASRSCAQFTIHIGVA